MPVYPDGCLTAGYPKCLGAVTGVTGVLASVLGADGEGPSEVCFADAGHASLCMGLPVAAGLMPVCSYH